MATLFWIWYLLTQYFLCASFIIDILKTEEREEIGHFTNQVQLEFPEVWSLHLELCLFLYFAELSSKLVLLNIVIFVYGS